MWIRIGWDETSRHCFHRCISSHYGMGCLQTRANIQVYTQIHTHTHTHSYTHSRTRTQTCVSFLPTQSPCSNPCGLKPWSPHINEAIPIFHHSRCVAMATGTFHLLILHWVCIFRLIRHQTLLTHTHTHTSNPAQTYTQVSQSDSQQPRTPPYPPLPSSQSITLLSHLFSLIGLLFTCPTSKHWPSYMANCCTTRSSESSALLSICEKHGGARGGSTRASTLVACLSTNHRGSGAAWTILKIFPESRTQDKWKTRGLAFSSKPFCPHPPVRLIFGFS